MINVAKTNLKREGFQNNSILGYV